MENYRQLYESVFNKNLADDDARDFLQDVTQQYPFFSPAQFLLLHKTANTDIDYKQQLIKTSAAFNNNYWLNYLLLQKDKEAFIESFSAQETIADEPQQEEFISIHEQTNIADTELLIGNMESSHEANHEINEISEPGIVELPDTQATFIQDEQTPSAPAEINEEVIHIATTRVDEGLEHAEHIAETTISDYKETTAEPVEVDEPVIVNEVSTMLGEANTLEQSTLAIEETIAATTDESFVAEQEPTVEEKDSEPAIESAQEIITEPEHNIEDESNIEAEKKSLPEVNTAQQIDHEFHQSFDTNDEEISAENNEGYSGAAEEDFTTPLKTDLAEAAAILDTKPVENGPVFEPLHTTDYFASVGIKLSDEIKPGDRLGNQLKSFTEWLKTMKKLPGQTANVPESSEKQNNNIQQLAENSNKEDEIITEAMADVLMQQGRIDKAVEVLKKLSLLNPSKNTYFAAKIDQLKED